MEASFAVQLRHNINSHPCRHSGSLGTKLILNRNSNLWRSGWWCECDSDLHTLLATCEARCQATAVREIEGTIPHVMDVHSKARFARVHAGSFGRDVNPWQPQQVLGLFRSCWFLQKSSSGIRALFFMYLTCLARCGYTPRCSWWLKLFIFNLSLEICTKGCDWLEILFWPEN